MSFEYDTADRSTAPRGELLREPANWPLLYETAKRLQHRQLLGMLERQGRHLVLPRLPVDFDARYERRVPPTPRTTPEPVRENTAALRSCLTPSRRATSEQRLDEVVHGSLTFLNTTLDVASGEGITWFHPALAELPGLWALKFHGFEFLEWAVLTADSPAECPAVHATLTSWIRDWAAAPETRIGAEQYLRRAWTPHAVSLRVLNLARYYAWCVDDEDDTAFLQLLRRLIFKNALFLENHVEYDIGGNHLIENAVALVIAGVLFEDEEPPWLERGLSILEDETEQFLEDGGHFERSPMYHTITLTRYLTALSLLNESGRHCPVALLETARNATGFLSAIRPPDGRIPLLNDSVYGQALDLDSCLAYARTVDETLLESTDTRQLPASGYYWLGRGNDRLLVDGGPFGPRHLPGHSHNDFFSVLLWVDGTQILTDTGTYHYAPDSRRQYSRSVRSHNTVQVDDVEPIPIGGQYLAGEPLDLSVAYVQSRDYDSFEGSYTRKTEPRYSHRRRICGGEGWWLVEDTVTGTGGRPVRQHLHFHPDVDLGTNPSAADGFAVSRDGDPLVYLLPVGADDVIQRATPYFPEFSREQLRPAVVFERETGGTMRFLLSTEPYSIEDYRQLLFSIGDVGATESTAATH